MPTESELRDIRRREDDRRMTELMMDVKYLRKQGDTNTAAIAELKEGIRVLPVCHDHEKRLAALEKGQNEESSYRGTVKVSAMTAAIGAAIALAVQQLWDKIFR